MKTRQGHVWFEERLVGNLRSDDRGAIHFSYDSRWLDDGFPVSIRLPLSLGTTEVNAHGFFQGLLPEGASRQRICRQLRISPDDDAGLLLAIGEDCAGALSIVPEGREPDVAPAAAELISADQLRSIIRSAGTEAAAVFSRRRRFSLAGAQEKLPVICRDDQFFKPTRAEPSTHLLKFETHPWVCFTEYTTLRLARRLGLPVIDCGYATIESAGDEIPFLTIPRYDRVPASNGAVRRLHQEDMVQALGYETSAKYQVNGGPGLGAMVNLLREETASPPTQILQVLQWQLFNFLTGNYDGHGKNLSLLYPATDGLPQLAPAYDLISIEYLNQVGNAGYAREMALAIGDEYVPERAGRQAWRQFATDLGIRQERVFQRLGEMAESLPTAAVEVHREFAESFGDKPVYEQLPRIIASRCQWIQRVLG